MKDPKKSNVKITAREKTKENVDVSGFRGMKKRGDGEWEEKFFALGVANRQIRRLGVQGGR